MDSEDIIRDNKKEQKILTVNLSNTKRNILGYTAILL